MTDHEAIGRVTNEISLKSRLDFLVLSVGSYKRSHEPEVFERQIAANLLGPYALLQRLLRMLIEAKGKVVFINSSRVAAGAVDNQNFGRKAAEDRALGLPPKVDAFLCGRGVHA